MKLPVPNDWNGEDYALMLVCIPDSVQWKAIARGAFYDLTWWKAWDNNTGDTYAVRDIANEIYESIMVCKLDDLVSEFKRLNAILAGEAVSLPDGNGGFVNYDYSQGGIAPQLSGINEDLDALEALPDLAALGQLPDIVTNLANLALDTDALAALSNLSSLADINTNLENLQRLVDINTALGQLSDLGALPYLAGNSDALQALGNLSNLLDIAAHLGNLQTEATTANDHAANIAAELGDLNANLDFLNQLETMAVELAELSQRFKTHNAFYPDQDIADVLSNTLYGRYVDIPVPGEGMGIADIMDKQAAVANTNLTTLHGRFVQADNVIGQLNMAETMEHLLRKTGLLDPEAQPNVSDVLDNVLRLGGNESWWGLVKRKWRDTLIKLGLSEDLADIDETTITQAIMLLVAAGDNGGLLRSIAKAIEESQTVVNLNNTTNCKGSNGSGKAGLNGNGNNGTITLTDEGINVQIQQPETNPLLGDGS